MTGWVTAVAWGGVGRYGGDGCPLIPPSHVRIPPLHRRHLHNTPRAPLLPCAPEGQRETLGHEHDGVPPICPDTRRAPYIFRPRDGALEPRHAAGHGFGLDSGHRRHRTAPRHAKNTTPPRPCIGHAGAFVHAHQTMFTHALAPLNLGRKTRRIRHANTPKTRPCTPVDDAPQAHSSSA